MLDDECFKQQKTVFGKIILTIVLEYFQEKRAGEGRSYHKIIDIHALSDVIAV